MPNAIDPAAIAPQPRGFRAFFRSVLIALVAAQGTQVADASRLMPL